MKQILFCLLTVVSVASFAEDAVSAHMPVVRTITKMLAPMSARFEGTGSVLKGPQKNADGTSSITLGLNVLTAASGCQKFDSARLWAPVQPVPVPVTAKEDETVVPGPTPWQAEFYSAHIRGPLADGACTTVMHYESVVLPVTVPYYPQEVTQVGVIQLRGIVTPYPSPNYEVLFNPHTNAVTVRPQIFTP